MRVALVHYWLVNWRGGEQVLGAIADLFPQADIFTHVADSRLIAERLPGRRVITTAISHLPFARTMYQRYLPLMPLALEELNLQAYDLVISSESGPAKGVITGPNTLHLCYCHSPMRYVWDRYHDYRMQAGRLSRLLMGPVMHYVRNWDQLSANRVDRYAANSQFVAKRIWKYYRREAQVIHPPVAVHSFEISTSCEEFYLAVGQLVPYKRADLLVEAFNLNGRPLVIIGTGEMERTLRSRAKSNIRFLGWQPLEVLKRYYAKCRALIFPGIEDFGIVPVEAMACGKPVVCLAAGGALETVIDGVTGVYFREQTAAQLNAAVDRFERSSGDFSPEKIREHSMQFSEPNFRADFQAFVSNALSQYGGDSPIRP